MAGVCLGLGGARGAFLPPGVGADGLLPPFLGFLLLSSGEFIAGGYRKLLFTGLIEVFEEGIKNSLSGDHSSGGVIGHAS